MKKHGFTPEDITRVCSYNPGKFINQFIDEKPARTTVQSGRYGEIKEGFVGSLTIRDVEKSGPILQSHLKTKCGWSPFQDMIFPGSRVMTIIKGKVYE
jgi:dihydroorotase